MKIEADWLSSAPSQKICAAFKSRGFEIYFVGGCVRNALMGRDVSDLDLATSATPSEVLDLAVEAGIKAIPTGVDHGTITLLESGIPYEVTTFRSDINTDGRHAEVAFTTSLTQDAKRRDFTMNALYATDDGVVHDPISGLVDLQNGIVRFIGDPVARISEDHLRILRFFRFYAWYANTELGIDADGLSACAEKADQIPELSKERITSELLKILSAPDPSTAVASMAASGVLLQILPGASSDALPIYIHHEQSFDLQIDPIARLAVLGGTPSDHLRLSKKEARKLSCLREQYQSAAHVGYKLKKLAPLQLAIFASLMGQDVRAEDMRIAEIGAEAVFPISAADLQGNFAGKALGDKLKELESLWLDSGFGLSKEELLA